VAAAQIGGGKAVVKMKPGAYDRTASISALSPAMRAFEHHLILSFQRKCWTNQLVIVPGRRPFQLRRLLQCGDRVRHPIQCESEKHLACQGILTLPSGLKTLFGVTLTQFSL
jgi:hypothetical protein